MRQGLVSIGLTTLDVVARPIDALPEAESTVLIEGVALAKPESSKQATDKRGRKMVD